MICVYGLNLTTVNVTYTQSVFGFVSRSQSLNHMTAITMFSGAGLCSNTENVLNNINNIDPNLAKEDQKSHNVSYHL